MKTTLLTAFEPFGGRLSNASLEVLQALPASLGGCRLARAELPVRGREMGATIRRLIARHKPSLIVSFGLAAGETSIRVERFALNIQDYGLRDNSGYMPAGKKIRRDGPAAYFVNTSPEAAVAAALKAGAPAYISNHAGTYVCNHLMYEAMSAVEEAGNGMRFAFIHLPFSTEGALLEKQGKTLPPSLPRALLVKASAAAILALGKSAR
jgi:pyroglutamyl-peptidase